MNPLTDLGDTSAQSEQHFNFFLSGWYFQNMIVISRLHQDFVLAAVDEQSHRVLPKIAEGLEKAINAKRTTPYNIFANMLMPALSKAAAKTARTQTFVDAACIACALERYRLAYGQFPEKLADLSPQFIEKIPHDVMDGQPLRYRKNGDDNYLLYSIGWNEKDDGGSVVLTKGNPPGADWKQGDWVWQLPKK
jgi:hypothetical protein